MKRGSIEMEKVVAWALGVILALVLIFVIVLFFAPGTEGSLVHRLIDRITFWR